MSALLFPVRTSDLSGTSKLAWRFFLPGSTSKGQNIRLECWLCWQFHVYDAIHAAAVTEKPMSRPGEEQVVIEGPAGPIEAVVTTGDRAGLVAIICHPNPVQGGTMQNKVVHTLMRTARDMGASTLRFNFRGVGRSAGEHDYGVGEVQDCLAVIAWARAELQMDQLWLMGFSFGGYVAAAAASELPAWPERLVLVAPSVEKQRFGDLKPLGGAAIVMMGEADDVVAPQSVYDAFADEADSTVVRFADTGHFFHGQLVPLKTAVEEALS